MTGIQGRTDRDKQTGRETAIKTGKTDRDRYTRTENGMVLHSSRLSSGGRKGEYIFKMASDPQKTIKEKTHITRRPAKNSHIIQGTLYTSTATLPMRYTTMGYTGCDRKSARLTIFK